MIYSRWDPSTGHYVYYEADDRAGLNDDLPTPAMPPTTKIGVPSIECGRPVPPGAVVIGEGELAMGSIAPPLGVRLLGGVSSFGPAAQAVGWFLAGSFVTLGILWLVQKGRRAR